MQVSDVLSRLEANKNDRGMANWAKMANTGGLSSYGIGLTVLRKLAKQIGRDRDLALALWETDIYDAKVIGLLIDDPKQITIEQAEKQVQELGKGMLTHVFSSCDATLAKSPVAIDLALCWSESDDELRKKSAYGLWYELSKKKHKRLSEALFMAQVEKISDRIDHESKGVRLSMGGALMGIGKRSIALNKAALAVADRVGSIDFSEDGKKCEPMDFAKHLKSDYIRTKLGLD